MGLREEVYGFIRDYDKGDVELISTTLKKNKKDVLLCLKQLEDEGRIYKGSRVQGYLYKAKDNDAPESDYHEKTYSINLPADDIIEEMFALGNIEKRCNKNCRAILRFVYRSLIDNAKKHSKSDIIDVSIETDSKDAEINVADNGLGILKSMVDKTHFPDEFFAMMNMFDETNTADMNEDCTIAARMLIMHMLAEQLSLQTHDILYDKYNEYSGAYLSCNYYEGTRLRFLISRNTRRKVSDYIIENERY
ncbi:MAG: ATP-binding protein [candidate division WOR-3 bacterium]|nr:ATP-binding protein [candidate division WOR-3 bacterium]